MDHILFYGLFVLASFWVALEPGPGFVRLSTQIVRQGRIPAFFTAFGMFAGALPFVLLVSMGLSKVIEAIPNLLMVLKVVGGLYLIWLAFNLLRKGDFALNDQARNNVGAVSQQNVRASMKGFFGGMMLVILNPRTLLFYSAFLPLFLKNSIDLAASTQLLLLGFAVSSIFLMTDVIFVLAISCYGSKIWSGRLAGTIARYIGATALSVFGLRLLLDRD